MYGESPAVAKRLPDSNQRTVSLDGAADDDVSQANNESRAPAKPRDPFLSGSPQIECAGFSVPRECFLEVHDGSYNRFPGKLTA